MSFSLHSSTENFGGGRRSSSSGSNSSSSCSVSVKSLIGRDVAERLGEALVEEPLEALALDGDEVRQLQRLVEVGERIALTGHGTRGHGSTQGFGGGRSGRAGARRTSPMYGAGAQHARQRRSYATGTGTSTAAVHARDGRLPRRRTR